MKGQARAGNRFLGATYLMYIAFLSYRRLSQSQPLVRSSSMCHLSAPSRLSIPKARTSDCREKGQRISCPLEMHRAQARLLRASPFGSCAFFTVGKQYLYQYHTNGNSASLCSLPGPTRLNQLPKVGASTEQQGLQLELWSLVNTLKVFKKGKRSLTLERVVCILERLGRAQHLGVAWKIQPSCQLTETAHHDPVGAHASLLPPSSSHVSGQFYVGLRDVSVRHESTVLDLQSPQSRRWVPWSGLV